MKSSLQAFAAVALLLGVAACNTIAGAGRDVESVGDATADAAEDIGDELDN